MRNCLNNSIWRYLFISGWLLDDKKGEHIDCSCYTIGEIDLYLIIFYVFGFLNHEILGILVDWYNYSKSLNPS